MITPFAATSAFSVRRPSVGGQSIRMLAMFFPTVFRSMPSPTVRFACGSRSRQRTRCPSDANAPPRLIVHVVLPTPPFWLATAMIVPTRFLPSFPSPVTTRTCGSGARDSPRGARPSIARVLQRQRRDSENWFASLTAEAIVACSVRQLPCSSASRDSSRAQCACVVENGKRTCPARSSVAERRTHNLLVAGSIPAGPTCRLPSGTGRQSLVEHTFEELFWLVVDNGKPAGFEAE